MENKSLILEAIHVEKITTTYTTRSMLPNDVLIKKEKKKTIKLKKVK